MEAVRTRRQKEFVVSRGVADKSLGKCQHLGEAEEELPAKDTQT